jgi:hypothetical protein
LPKKKNINEQTLIGGMLEARKQNLQEAVSNGYLTQEQADERLGWMNERIKGQAENGGGRFGHGGCGDGCHQ